MKSNIIIKIVAVFAVVILATLMFKGRQEKNASVVGDLEAELADLVAIEQGPQQIDNGLDLDPLDDEYLEQEYGVDVDSPLETMRTLTNETRAVREDSVKLQEENKKLKQEVERLLKMEDSLNKRVQSKFEKAGKEAERKERELEHTNNLTRDLISRLESRLEELSDGKSKNGGNKTANGYDIDGAGIPSGLGYDEDGLPVDYDQVVWTNPIDAKIDPKKGTITLPDFAAEAVDHLPDIAKGPTNSDSKKKEDRKIKAYTIPGNATLIGSVSMTAMLGRIPTNGQVQDPYPFKIMVGEDNLSSNGIKIPGVTGIKMSGIAKGDWTLSCVSGQINSMTFTFQDGTIVTIPEPGTKANESLAWFSDENGIPCITGKRITNAASYLSQRVGLTAASSYANAEAASQFTTSSNADGGFTSGVTGDPKTVAKNTAISEGLNEVTDWLDQRQSNSFDAIYVPPGTQLALHINNELKIDYDPEGRKVNHYANIDRRSEHHLD